MLVSQLVKSMVCSPVFPGPPGPLTLCGEGTGAADDGLEVTGRVP